MLKQAQQTQQPENKVFAVWQTPFSIGSPTVETWVQGISLDHMVDQMQCLPEDFKDKGYIRINDENVPKCMWHMIKPKASSFSDPIIITMHLPMQGGGGDGKKKNLFSLVAAIAITIVSQGAAGGLFQTAGGLFAKGSISALLLSGAISIVGALILGALTSPPAVDQATQDDQKDLGVASARGNILDPNGPIPRVIGTRRIFPPMAFEPIVELQGQDEIVQAVYVLAGPHKLEDIRLGDSVVDEAANGTTDITIEVREGTASDNAELNLNRRIGRTFEYNTQMTVHDVDPEDQSLLLGGSGGLPVWHGMGSKKDADEVWIALQFQGLVRNSAATATLRVPFRLRMKLRTSSVWRNLPELHYIGNSQGLVRTQMKIFFQAITGTLPNAPTNNTFVEARKHVDGQVIEPATSDFDADSYFSVGAGNDYYINGNESTTNVQNVKLTPDGPEIYLDPASWPEGAYDIEIIRGATITDSSYAPATYLYSGVLWDFFGYQGSNAIPLTRAGLQDTTIILRATSIWNSSPLNQKDLAVISITAKNRTVDRLSVKASGYVYNFNTTSNTWTDYEITSNPAAWYREILSGTLNYNPLPEELLDLSTLEEWWDRCDTNDYTCDLIAQGIKLEDLSRIIASCGYARPYQSDVWGVVQDYDRSAELPVQIINARNSKNFSWAKAFPRLPAGLRINYSDALDNYETRQVNVLRPGMYGSQNQMEQVTYEGFVDETKTTLRGTFDIEQATARSTFYDMTMPIEWIRCRRGSLVGVNFDIMVHQNAAARIKSINLSGPDIASIVLDTEVTLHSETEMLSLIDIFAVTDIFDVGLQSGIAIRDDNGAINIHPISNATGTTDTLTFSPVLAGTNIGIGNLVAIGLIGNEYKRMLVNNIEPQQDQEAVLTLVDEAPELWDIFT